MLWIGFFTLWAVALTVFPFTYILGAPALKVLRRRLGPLWYWVLTLAIVGLFVAFHRRIQGIEFLSVVTLMGVFEEFEEMGLSLKISAFFTLLVNVLLSAGGMTLWTFLVGRTAVSAALDLGVKALSTSNLQIVSRFVPGLAIGAWLICIYLAILLEDFLSLEEDNAPPREFPSFRSQLQSFRVPDVLIWAFIMSLLGAYGGFHASLIEAVAINAMVICVILFYFQGLAVASTTFGSTREGIFWHLLMATQLYVFTLLGRFWHLSFLLVVAMFVYLCALVGLVDYWLNFRYRLAKQSESFNREA